MVACRHLCLTHWRLSILLCVLCTGAKQLPATAVNDDYCDCVDGSDETHTSACSGSVVGSGGSFTCAVGGYRSPVSIQSSKVHDGICDCCDGSDESGNGSRALCANTCADLQAESIKSLQEERSMIAKGLLRYDSDCITTIA